MNQESNREFEVEYYDTSHSDGVVDVSFELTKDAEDVLFRALAREIEDDISSGTFPKQKMHLVERLTDQYESHPPWIESNTDVRTYDLEMTEWDYHVITKIIGKSMSNLLGPEASEKYEDLLDAWRKITTDMQVTMELKEIQEEINSDIKEDIKNHLPSNPSNGSYETTITIEDGSAFEVYKNERTGDTWYVCTMCRQSYSEIGSEHTCQN